MLLGSQVMLLAGWLAVSSGAEVRVVTVPEGADVWSGKVRLGTTTRDGLVLVFEAGVLRITVRKDGFRAEERTVTVESGAEPTVILVRLQPSAPEAQPQSSSDTKAEPSPTPSLQPSSASGGGTASVPVPLVSPAASGGGGGHTGLVLGILGGAAAVGVGVATLGGEDPPDPLTIDNDGDGFSEQQGDCLDSDRSVSPNGVFSMTVTSPVVGTVQCTAPWGGSIVRATNLTCQPVTINSILRTNAVIAGNCTVGSASFSIPIRSATLPGGSRDIVVAETIGSGTAGCCPNGRCGGSNCTFEMNYRIDTTRGPYEYRTTYGIIFPAGNSCPACPSSTSPEVGAQGCPLEEAPPLR